MQVVCGGGEEEEEEKKERKKERKKESAEEEDGWIIYAGTPEFRELRIRVDAMDSGDGARIRRRI
jgi:hypothetical protein